MTKRMLIDATHAEETRVVVLDGNRLEDFDVETSTKRQLKGNIYLAKVVRVEPSLQAAFVEYGGGRHGFLAFGEIHPDYYQIPVADRERLIAAQEAEARAEEEAEERAAAAEARGETAPAHGAEVSRHDVSRAYDENDWAAEDRAPPEPAGADSPAFAASSFDPVDLPGSEDPASQHDAIAAADQGPSQLFGVEHDAPIAHEPAHQAPAVQEAAAHEHAADEHPGGDHDAHHHADTGSTEPPAAAETHFEPVSADPLGTPEGAHPAADHVEPHEAPADGLTGGVHQDEPPETERPEHQSRSAQPAIIEHETVSAAVEDLVAEPETPPPVRDEAAADFVPSATDPRHAASHAALAADDREHGFTEPSDQPDIGYFDADQQPDIVPPEIIGGEGPEDRPDRRIPPRFLRNYKIQEVIKRRQILLIQVVKEERGTKGAALTTYISLAGRYCVLMPNSPRGGGISRRITSAADRRRLREVTSELDLPRGMGMIVRTAGANRPKPEIKRDCEYLMRLWDDIREHTLRSVAPALIYEEASLIKRAIRDVYSRDIDEIIVDGEAGWRAARDFMRMLMPAHASKVQLWRGDGQPLFARHQVDAQLDAMMSPTVQLRSGGYLVINQTEALVAIDVNSGRSTRERGIEETALRTNLEAADEAARQLRLRDLAGLIVIDFIDMEAKKHNVMVERRMKEALKNDRARIQLGSISHFGLLEMSRQRLRPSLTETSFITCPHCAGLGHVRSTESAAIHVLRAIEEEGAKRRAAEIVVHVASTIAFYILNNKRDRLGDIETRYAMHVSFAGDDTLLPPETRIDRVRAQISGAVAPAITQDRPPASFVPLPSDDPDVIDAADVDLEEDEDLGDAGEANGEGIEAQGGSDAESASDTPEEAERKRRRRRRRRRGARREDGSPNGSDAGDEQASDEPSVAAGPMDDPEAVFAADLVRSDEIVAESWTNGSLSPEGVEARAHQIAASGAEHAAESGAESGAELGAEGAEARNRRRGRRGGAGTRRRRRDELEVPPVGELGAEQPDVLPVYAGPTPADPFGGQQAFDIFDAIERAATQAAAQTAAMPPATEPVLRGPFGVEPAVHGHAVAQNVAPPTEPAASAVADSATEPASPLLADAGAGVDPGAVAAPVSHPAPSDPVAEHAGENASGHPEEPVGEHGLARAPEPPLPPAVLHEPATQDPVSPVAPPAEPVSTAPEPEPEPLIKPILVGSEDAPPVEKKRGWWRR